jgi:hypothetical protein
MVKECLSANTVRQGAIECWNNGIMECWMAGGLPALSADRNVGMPGGRQR